MQQTPIEKAIAEFEDNVNQIEKALPFVSENDLVRKGSYECAIEILKSLLPYEKQHLRGVAEKAVKDADPEIMKQAGWVREEEMKEQVADAYWCGWNAYKENSNK